MQLEVVAEPASGDRDQDHGKEGDDQARHDDAGRLHD